MLDKGPTSFVEETILSPFGYIYVSLFLGYLFCSVIVPAPNCFNSCCCVIYFEVRQCDASIFVVLSQDGFGYLGYFVVPSEFYNCFCYYFFYKKIPFGFNRDCPESVDCVGKYSYFHNTRSSSA